MYNTIRHYTPTILDVKTALGTFGLSAKEQEDAIGRFGTGLKYAVAVILRNGGAVIIVSGGTKYRFYTKAASFRGKEFSAIHLQVHSKGRWRNSMRIPFTTELGSHWEPWMAYRELHSNTLDEGGETTVVPDTWSYADFSGGTHIIVAWPEYAQVHHSDKGVFLDPTSQCLYKDSSLEIHPGANKWLYYRGIRAYELDKPSLYTYNFKVPMDLTEDRTFRYQYMAQHYVLSSVVTRCDEHSIIDGIFHAQPGDWEYSLGLDVSDLKPSPTITGMYGGAYSGDADISMPLLSNRAKTFLQRAYAPKEPSDMEKLGNDLQWWIDSGKLAKHEGLPELIAKAITFLGGEKSDDTPDMPF